MKFALNDPVRITASPSRLFDATGTVTDIDRGARHPFQVTTTDPHPLWFGPHELILAEHQPRTDERPAA